MNFFCQQVRGDAGFCQSFHGFNQLLFFRCGGKTCPVTHFLQTGLQGTEAALQWGSTFFIQLAQAVVDFVAQASGVFHLTGIQTLFQICQLIINGFTAAVLLLVQFFARCCRLLLTFIQLVQPLWCGKGFRPVDAFQPLFCLTAGFGQLFKVFVQWLLQRVLYFFSQ